jgi:hypothetical protein
MNDSRDKTSSESNVHDVDQAVGVPENTSSLPSNHTDSLGQSPTIADPSAATRKRKSSQNAIKYGIFSKVTILHGESRQEYCAMFEGLREAIQPIGKLVELVVETLAIITWRYRRFLTAEGAEIQKGTVFLELDQQRKKEEEADKLEVSRLFLEGVGQNPGLIQKLRDPYILARCLRLLVVLRQGIEARGFDREQDSEILKKIYGDNGHLFSTLPNSYSIWSEAVEASEKERQRGGYPAPEKCKKNILDAIDKEIKGLEAQKQAYASMESRRTELERLRLNVPDSPQLDRLLRYEAALERAFDRSLSQLERLQRMRRGQPVAPRIDVNLST